MDVLIYVLIAVGAFCIGVYIGRKRTKNDGLFIVDDSDDKTTRWTLDVKIDPKEIPNKKEIRLKIIKMDEGDV